MHTPRLIAAYIGLYAAIGALYPYLPLHYQELGLGLGAIGLLAAAYAAAGMVGAPLWGATADHVGASRPLLAAAAVAAAVAATLLAGAGGALMILLCAAGLSLAMAGISPLLDARAMEVIGATSAEYGRLRVWGSISFIVAVVLTGWLVEAGGIGMMWWVMVPALLATALVGFPIRPGSGAPQLARRTALARVARSDVMPFLAIAVVVWSASSAINAFFSIHLRAVGAPESVVGIAWAIGAAVEVPLMFAYPALRRRVGLETLLLAGAALFALRAAAVLVTDEPLIVTLSMLVHGAAFALFLVGGVMYVSERAPRGTAATAQGMLAASGFGLAQVLGPGLGGIVGRWLGLVPMFAVAGALSVLSVFGLALVLRR